jgi:hypothetical protein
MWAEKLERKRGAISVGGAEERGELVFGVLVLSVIAWVSERKNKKFIVFYRVLSCFAGIYRVFYCTGS